jgi:hypothetical protein
MECAGVITGIQAPLMIIDQRGISTMFIVFLNHIITHLRVRRCLEIRLESLETPKNRLERTERVPRESDGNS